MQFTAADGNRRPIIRLGKVTQRHAEEIKRHVEELLYARSSGAAPKPSTADWVRDVPAGLRRRLERLGLVEPAERRQTPTLAEWLEAYIAGRKDVKPGTRINLEQAKGDALAFFKGSQRLDRVTAGDAERFRVWLKAERGLAEATVRRRCKRLRQFFAAAINDGLLSGRNPFAGVRCSDVANEARRRFVPREDIEKVIEAAPDAEWRAIFALARYAGLRTPSETLAVQWSDVDWQRGRLRVASPKTADSGKSAREVPLLPGWLKSFWRPLTAPSPVLFTWSPAPATAPSTFGPKRIGSSGGRVWSRGRRPSRHFGRALRAS